VVPTIAPFRWLAVGFRRVGSRGRFARLARVGSFFTIALLLAGDPFALQRAFASGPAERDQATTVARSLTVDQIAAMREVMEGAPVTPELLVRFWRPLRAAGLSPEDLGQLSDLVALRDAGESALAYRREAWESARLSYAARKVIRTPALDALEASSQKEATRTSFEATKTLLEAAANRRPLPVPGRDSVEITPALINATIASVDRVSAGLTALLNPDFLRRERYEVRMVIETPAGGAAHADVAQVTAEKLRRRIQLLRVDGSAEVTPGNRVEVRLSRVADPERVTRVLEANGSFALRWVRYPDSDGGVASREELLSHFGGRLPDDLEILAAQRRNGRGEVTGEGCYAVDRRPLAEGGVAKAVPGITKEGEPVVHIELEPAVAAALGDAAERNVGRNLAVVVDGLVVSAPRIDGRLGEYVVLRGGFTWREVEELSAVLSGALPPGIKIVDQRVVGPAKD